MIYIELSTAVSAAKVGYKAARLAASEVPLPRSFVVTAQHSRKLFDKLPLEEVLEKLDPDCPASLFDTAKKIQSLVVAADVPEEFLASVASLSKRLGPKVAVRSSAPLEDTEKLSFAGQYDTFLSVNNSPEVLTAYIKRVWASLYTARALSYRHHNQIPQTGISMAVLIQDMVEGLSGVLFTVNPNNGKKELLIEFSKDGVVQGTTIPKSIVVRNHNDIKEYPPLTENDITLLVAYSKTLTAKFGCPLDIEWVQSRAGICPLQIRPLTINPLPPQKETPYTTAIPILLGTPIGKGIYSGVVQKVESPASMDFKSGNVLVVRDTSPDWEPLMRKASMLITDHGSLTSHASLTAREMGLPALVGCGDALWTLADGQVVTAELQDNVGFVYGSNHVKQQQEV